MNRRSFLSALAGLPLVGRMVPRQSTPLVFDIKTTTGSEFLFRSSGATTCTLSRYFVSDWDGRLSKKYCPHGMLVQYEDLWRGSLVTNRCFDCKTFTVAREES